MGSKWFIVFSLPRTGDMSFMTEAKAFRTWLLGSITSCCRHGNTCRHSKMCFTVRVAETVVVQ